MANKVIFTIRGSVPPVFTPLNEDQSINFSVIPQYATYLADNGVKAVLVGGTTGESMTRSVAERKQLIDAWVKAAKTTKLQIISQVGGAPLVDVLELARYTQSAGADAILTLPELYFKPKNVEELVSYVELVAKAAPKLPVLYYHIPHMSRVEVPMPAFVTAATKRIPNFRGLKFTCNDLTEADQVRRALQDGQEMFLGADPLLGPAAVFGIKSGIGTIYNLFPKLSRSIPEAIERNDVATAYALQEKLNFAIQAHTPEGDWVPIMKAGMEIVSKIKMGPPSLPQKPLSPEAVERIRTKLQGLGLIN